MAAEASTAVVSQRKRACDPCKARKVRCNGELKCQQCSHLGLRCNYTAPKARAKHYERGRVLRDWQIDSSKQRALIPLASTPEESSSNAISDDPVIDEAVFADFLTDYEQSVYPFHPIISPAEAEQAVQESSSSNEARAFCYALAAVTINLARPDSASEKVKPWIEMAIKLQQPLLSLDQMTARHIITVQWIHGCLMGMKNYDLAYFYLRQATTMVQLLHIEDEQGQVLETKERARLQRLHYMIFVHERFMALAHQRDLLLSPLSQLSIIDTSIPANVDHGFRQIVRLFMHVDQELLSKWNRSDDTVTPTWIEAKHQAIEDESINAFDKDMGLTDSQLADLIITKHWLHMLLWQIAVSQCLLSSSSEEQFMTLLFPIRISSQLRSVLTTLPQGEFMIHGTAMHSKLFEIADTIGNVLITVPALSAEVRAGRIADFLFLLHFLSSFPRRLPKQHSVLEEKLNTLRGMFPGEV